VNDNKHNSVTVSGQIADLYLSRSKDCARLAAERDELLAAMERIKYSMEQALVIGNDKFRECKLSLKIAETAIAKAKAKGETNK
jgi:hypothetical protein